MQSNKVSGERNIVLSVILTLSSRFVDNSSPGEVENLVAGHVNSEYKVRVSSLSLTLNKVNYPLAKIKIAGLSSMVNLRENNMSVKGKLMKINLLDMSPHGKMYREKLVLRACCPEFVRVRSLDNDDLCVRCSLVP